MTAYLTPLRFRTMRHGAKLATLSDFDLAELLADAQAVVDSYCNMPYGGSFLGGVVVGEQRPWRYPNTPYGDSGSRRVYPKFNPIVSVEGLRLVVGSEASASLPVDSLVVNNAERWVEVTSASIVGSSGLFGVSGWVVPFGGLEQPVAEIDYTYGTLLPVVGERVYPINNAGLIYQTSNGHLSGAVTVYDNEVEVDSGDYEIDRLEGRLTFGVTRTGPVTVDYSHRLYREIVTASSMVAADLLGASNLVAKGMSGVRSLSAGEIRIERESAKDLGRQLDKLLPNAALALEGFRYWSVA